MVLKRNAKKHRDLDLFNQKNTFEDIFINIYKLVYLSWHFQQMTASFCI